jgi:hypothetical protein
MQVPVQQRIAMEIPATVPTGHSGGWARQVTYV